MSDELSIINGTVEMAFLESEGQAWHGLGQAVPTGADTYAWLAASNMGAWTIKSAPVLFYDEENDEVLSNRRNKVLYRSDTREPLSTVGSSYKPVQPAEVIEFFTDIINGLGFEMCTAGVLFGGRKFWAQANIGQSVNILGKDRVDGKLLLATACDGSLATTAQWTTTRVVCNNTLSMAVNGRTDRLKVSHAKLFDANKVKEELGLVNDSFKEWASIAERMTQIEILEADTIDYFARVFDIYTPEEMSNNIDDRLQIAGNSKTVMNCYELFCGTGQGSELVTAKGTLWGAVNAVTEYADHRRATRTIDSRMDSAWFGTYNGFKNRAWDEALLKVA